MFSSSGGNKKFLISGRGLELAKGRLQATWPSYEEVASSIAFAENGHGYFEGTDGRSPSDGGRPRL
jgi:hypothetical protein